MNRNSSRLRVVPQSASCAEVSPKPIRRPLTGYPLPFYCPCANVEMERQTATDRGPSDTPRRRFEDGCNECFVCPECRYQELFPIAGMSMAQAQRLYPGFGSRRFNAGQGDAA